MKPRVASIQLVGEHDRAQAIAIKACQRVFPHAVTHVAHDLAEAIAQKAKEDVEMLVLLVASPADVVKAAATVDPRGLSRWCVVARGITSTESTSNFLGVGHDDWNEAMLSLALGVAATLHIVERENSRLRGDLHTISRRLVHDLRSPLNCISTAVETIRELADPGDSPEKIVIQSMMDSVDEIVVLAERISMVLRATASPERPQHVTMEEIVWGTMQRLESRVLKVGATIAKPDAWPAVRGVPAWLDVIWVNLIVNSLQHAGPRPRIELGWSLVDGEYRFWLRDSGPGIAPAMRSRLFYPLDRMNELNAPHGLGLTIVQRLVELQRGRCGYEPQPEPGGSFFFTLPVT